MIIVQLKCTVICSQRLTVNIRLRLETPDRLCVCVSFLTSSCLILFLERIGETSRLLRRHGAGSRLRPRRDFTCVNLCEVCFSTCLFLCFSVCFLCIYVFVFPLELADHVETVTNKKKRRKCFYESVFCSVAGRVLLLPRRYRQPLMTGSERQRNHSLSDQSAPEETDVEDRKHYSDVNVTEHDNKTNISCLFLSILGELAQDVVF